MEVTGTLLTERVSPLGQFRDRKRGKKNAPALYGENSAEILDELGVSKEAQTALRESGAVTR